MALLANCGPSDDLLKAAAHTVTNLWQAVVNALSALPSAGCHNDFTAAGYNPS